MKKIISLVLVVVIICAVFAGCSSEKEAVTTDSSTSMEKAIGVLNEAFESEEVITVT